MTNEPMFENQFSRLPRNHACFPTCQFQNLPKIDEALLGLSGAVEGDTELRRDQMELNPIEGAACTYSK